MTQSSNESVNDPSIGIDQFREFLNNNPRIFVTYPELLETLELVDPQRDGVASLLEKQSEVLRAKLSQTAQTTSELIDTARENELITERMFQITCELLAADQLDNLLSALYAELKEKFDVDHIVIRIAAESPQPGIAEIDPAHAEAPEYREALGLIGMQSHCGERLPNAIMQYLFAENSTQIGSAALIPLLSGVHIDRPLGVLALGSEAKQRFHGDLGTIHLDRLGALIGIALDRLLNS